MDGVIKKLSIRQAEVSINDIKLFWSLVEKCGPIQPHMKTACWVWLGKSDCYGYGYFSTNGQQVRVHRYSYAIHTGPIQNKKNNKTMLICHHCDYPSCVNPSHLFAGNHQQNSDDKISKDRQSGGVNSPSVRRFFYFKQLRK